MNQVVTFTGFEEKKRGTNKRGEWALRIFTAAGGTKYQTFDIDLGDKLIALASKPVEIDYELEQNGDFSNNVLKSVKEATSEQAAAAPTPIPVEDPRRSKEEMRRTDAVVGAASIITSLPEEQRTIQNLAALADQVVLYLEAGSSAFAPVEEAIQF